MTAAPPYRKLPGRRRGFVKGSSLWLGPDHLLSVKSLRIREEYKRFHFRDVQAITVAPAPRFYFSTFHLLIVLLWLGGYLAAVSAAPRYTWIPWSLGALLVLTWILISARWSCRCRLYTAVSRDELPSVSRIWTARKFLAQVTPHIAQVQGAVPANWAEAAEGHAAGTPESFAGLPDPAPPPSANARLHTLTADLFVATLWGSALANLLVLHSVSRLANWVQIFFGLSLLGETVLLFVQYYRGLLQRPMQRLAIANLAAVGGMYYARQMVFTFTQAAKQPAVDLRIPTFYAGDAWTRGIDAGICIILGLVGLGIIFLRKKPA